MHQKISLCALWISQQDALMVHSKFNWLNVLLIDDSRSILDYVSTVLEENYGITDIYQASSAIEAIQVLRESKHFNLIFVDLNMPNMDGIQLLKHIKKLNYQGYIGVVSGVATRIISSVELLAKQYEFNYVGTLTKPLHEKDFVKIFEQIGQSKTRKPDVESLRHYEIIRAIKNDDITVYYQPQVSLSDRKFVGVEALCRINHHRLGIVSPDQFIDKAEESELILHITFAVLKKSFHDWSKWKKMGLDIELSVNISPNSLQQDEFVDTILSLLSEYNMPANMLCIEVTENVLADNKSQELSNISRLNMHGIKIALDDFGKEHATIDRLQNLPINCLKIDKSYFMELNEHNHKMGLIGTTLALAEKLHITTCAEGIESKETMNIATEFNCDIAQGYFISEPLSAKEIIPWSTHWKQNT